MIETIAKTITMAKPSAFLPRKAAGITLAETLIYLSILAVVTAGIWQTFTFINSSINTNIERTAELDSSETYLNYISTLSGRAVASSISGDGSCIVITTESPSGDDITTTFKVDTPDDFDNGFLKASGWVSTIPGISCDLPPERPDWRPLTDKGDLSLVDASKSALDLGKFFERGVMGQPDPNYRWDNISNEIVYRGVHGVLGTTTFPAPVGLSSFSFDFWLRDPFPDTFTSSPDIDNTTLPDNTTLLAFGHETDPNRQVIFGFQDRKLALRRGVNDRRHITTITYDNITDAGSSNRIGLWNHIAVTFNAGDNTSKFYFNGSPIDNFSMDNASGPNGQLSFNFPLNSSLFLGGYDNFTGTTPQKSQSLIDELRIWNFTLSEKQINDRRQRESLRDATGLIGYWRFETTNDNPALTDSSMLMRDWTANENHLIYREAMDNVTYKDEQLPNHLTSNRAPITRVPFRKAGSNETLSLEMQFVVTNAFGAQQRQPTLSRRIPVVRFAPVGLVALEDDSSVEFDVEVIGSHDNFTIEFDAIFDPSVKPQANACDLYVTNTEGTCSFSQGNVRVKLNDKCVVPDNQSLATCIITSNDIMLTDGVAFSSIEIHDPGKDSGTYQTVPGDKITMQIYETCTFGADDDGTTAMLIDTGFMQGDDFINKYSYVTYSFEAEGSEDIEYLFGTTKGGDHPRFWTKNGKSLRDVVPGSPDFGAFTKRRHVSPFLYRTTDDTYNFVMGFDAPYIQWSDGNNLWNNHFTDRYDFDVASTDSNDPCSVIGMTEVEMCGLVENPDPVKVCKNPSNTHYCFIEFKISNMPTDPSSFVKLDEKDEFTWPTTTLEDFVGVNRWGNGYTDGFVVDLGVQDLQSYAQSRGDPLMQVKLRAGMDFWYLMTTPNSAKDGKSVKMRSGETDTVRYRLSTSKVCP